MVAPPAGPVFVRGKCFAQIISCAAMHEDSTIAAPLKVIRHPTFFAKYLLTLGSLLEPNNFDLLKRNAK